MLREDDIREVLKYGGYNVLLLKRHVGDWLQTRGKPSGDEAVIKEIVEKSLSYYHYLVSTNGDLKNISADNLIKRMYDGKNSHWKIKSETTGETSENTDGLGCATYLLLLLGPIGWGIFIYLLIKKSKK